MPDLDEQTRRLLSNLPQHIEDLQVLAAKRGAKSTPQAAIRRADLTAVLPQPTTMLKSKQINAAPTQADYNNLQKDVSVIFAMLTQIAEALR